jgi:type VI secretion system protein ImpA
MANKTTALLAPVAGATPCGPDLRGTLELAELERMARGKPAQHVGENLVVPAEEPAWPAVIERAQALLGRSKDLRVAVLLTRGLAASQGWSGLAAGLATVRGLLEGFWDGVHPQLDEEDGGDPTLRLNSLGELAGDEALAAFRQLILVSAPRAGRFSLRQRTTDAALFAAALAEAPAETVRATVAAVDEARAAVVGIEAVLGEQLGLPAVVLGKLDGLLAEAAAALAPAVTTAATPAPASVAALVAPGVVALPAGPVNSRADVVSALEAICRFYRTHEPSSPIPLLLERARRLVDKTFLELVEDLTPDGLAQLHLLRGPQANSETNA